MIAGLLSCVAVADLFDEGQNMNLHVLGSFMIIVCEMAANLLCAFFHVVQVSLEPVHQPSFGLSHILCFASCAGDAVDDIVGFAGNILHGEKLFL